MGLITQSTSNILTQGVKTTATALAANPKRRRWFIQNLGDKDLAVRFGAGADYSEGVFDLILNKCTTADDGTGGFYAEKADDIPYDGIVTVEVVDSSTPRYTVLEIGDNL